MLVGEEDEVAVPMEVLDLQGHDALKEHDILETDLANLEVDDVGQSLRVASVGCV